MSRFMRLAVVLFLLSRGLGVGVALYAPSLVLSVVLGWSESTTILLMGGTTIAYVAYGGNRSVIWTDVAQMALIWFGIFLVIMVELAQITPPVGFNLFIIQGLTGTPIMRVALAALPFFVLMCVGVVLLTAFPEIALWLPGVLFD